MVSEKHLFISATGIALPGWMDAFSTSQHCTPKSLPTQTAADLIWLRLQIELPLADQITSVRSVFATQPLLALSDLPNDEQATQVFGMGARAYANSHAGAQTLQQIANVVGQGGLWIGESMMQRLLSGIQKLPLPVNPSSSASHRLTGRELEVARAIAAGASNKEVARQLGITERTVKAHVSGLFTKLGVADRLQLALKIREFGNPV